MTSVLRYQFLCVDQWLDRSFMILFDTVVLFGTVVLLGTVVLFCTVAVESIFRHTPYGKVSASQSCIHVRSEIRKHKNFVML